MIIEGLIGAAGRFILIISYALPKEVWGQQDHGMAGSGLG
jgi:hypothetical protein